MSAPRRDSTPGAVPRVINRSIDHPAVLLPETRPKRADATPARLGRILVGFFYVTVTACLIILLGLSWRHEVHKRQTAEAAAAKSGGALASAQARLATLEERNQALSTRLTSVNGDLRTARSRLSRRTGALQDTRGLLRSTATFLAALDGLDEMIGDTVDDQVAIGTLRVQLDRHVGALDRYVRVTDPNDVERSALRAKLRLLTRDLAGLRTILARIAERKQALGDTIVPLGQTEELDRALKLALTRAKTALRR